MEFILIVILIGSIQGFFVSLVFLISPKAILNRLFSLVLFTISLALFFAYLQNVIDFREYPFLIKLSLPLSLLFIPLLLLYLRKITGGLKLDDSPPIWYFFPLIAVLLYNVPFYLAGADQKIEYYVRNELTGNPLFIDKIEGVFIELFIVIFSLIAVYEARKYKQKINLLYSDLEMGKSKWISFLAYAMLILSAFALVLSAASFVSDTIPLELNFITAVGSTLIVYFIAYYWLSSPEVFVELTAANHSLEKGDEPIEADSSEIKASKMSEFQQKIIHCLEAEQLYLNPSLTLTELANSSGVAPYLASKVINQNLNTTFYSLINSYRIEKVKQGLRSKEDNTIMEIAYDAGFNSKTAFYEAFKKDTGISPSQFIKDSLGESKSV